MRPKQHETRGSGDLFRARLDQIINMRHELAQLAGKIDWDFIDGEITPLYSDSGRPGIATRFVIGFFLLKPTVLWSASVGAPSAETLAVGPRKKHARRGGQFRSRSTAREHCPSARSRAPRAAYLQAAKIASTIEKSVLHVGSVRVVVNS
jgi:hypothetical protein